MKREKPPPPFIYTQQMRLLEEVENPWPYLDPGRFHAQRRGEEDGGRMMGVAPGGEGQEWEKAWREVGRFRLAHDCVQNADGSPCPLKRLVITTDSGVGKSTTLKWLRWELNGGFLVPQLRRGRVETAAFYVKLSELAKLTDARRFIADVLVSKFCRPKENNDESAARALLLRLREQGRLVLLFDELDQVSGEGPVDVVRDLLADPRWAECRFVIAGRPHALYRWRNHDLFNDRSIGWRFAQLDEFTEEEQRRFLGKDAEGNDRFDLIPEDARGILSTPRVLEYLHELDDAKLKKIESASDVYERATRHMLELALFKSSDGQKIAKGGSPEKMLRRARKVLAAIAFEMTSDMVPERVNADDANSPFRDVPNFERVPPEQFEEFAEKVRLRLVMSEDDFDRDLHALMALNDAIAQGLIDEHGKKLSQILWRDRTMQEFFTALWLTQYAKDEDVQRLKGWIYQPREAASRQYYWVWRYAAEMPERARNRHCWVRAMVPLYARGDGAADTRRSTEMIYRSWDTMEAYAEQYGHAGTIAARAEFLAEFAEEILSGKRGAEAARIAEELRASLKKVDEGDFRMGAPEEKQESVWGKNETPAEPIHHVDAFLLSRFPTLNAWYRLFDPGHRVMASQLQLWYDIIDRKVDDALVDIYNAPDTPVTFVNWYDAWVFCKWLHWDEESCRLPHEDEWEYAAKAETDWDQNYWWGDDFDATKCHANQWKGSEQRHPVPPDDSRANDWKFVDMLGNVWEWTGDGYRQEYARELTPESSARVLRGGGWRDRPPYVRSAVRVDGRPTGSVDLVGFRVARALP